MAEIVYASCFALSLLCAALLVRSYRRNRTRLLLWSSLCFVGLAMNNLALVIDLLVVPTIDLTPVRQLSALAALIVLITGLIWEGR